MSCSLCWDRRREDSALFQLAFPKSLDLNTLVIFNCKMFWEVSRAYILAEGHVHLMTMAEWPCAWEQQSLCDCAVCIALFGLVFSFLVWTCCSPVQRLSRDLHRVLWMVLSLLGWFTCSASVLELASVPMANKSIIVIRIHKVLVMVSDSSSRAGPFFRMKSAGMFCSNPP